LPWKLKFRALLEKNFADDSLPTWERYNKAFNKDYRSRTHPRFAVRDVANIEKLLRDRKDSFDLWGPFHEEDDYYRLQYYSFNRSYLNDLMPFLQNLDLCVLHEVDSDLDVDSEQVFIKSFAIKPNASTGLPFSQIKDLLLETLLAMRNNEVENDYLHRLQPLTGLSWREIDVFRGYRSYYFQLGSPFTKKRVADALINNAKVAHLLYRYFEGRFKPADHLVDPMTRELEVLSPIRQELLTALEVVSDNNEDKIKKHKIVEPYVYLFRTWKGLLQTAQKTKKIWIYDYNKKIIAIRKLYEKLQKFKLTFPTSPCFMCSRGANYHPPAEASALRRLSLVLMEIL
jgi:glutamate dehydrogenase